MPGPVRFPTSAPAREISATLYDDKGAIVGRNLAGTPEAGATFRSIFIDKTVTAGTWKLRLESTSTQQLKAVIAAWKNAATPRANGGLMALR